MFQLKNHKKKPSSDETEIPNSSLYLNLYNNFHTIYNNETDISKINILIFNFFCELLHVSNPKFHLQKDGCIYSFGIATGYGLDGPGIESRWGARFFAPVQTGPGAHPAACTMGTRSLPGVKSGRDVTLTPHPFLVPWSWKGRVIPLLTLWTVRPVQSLSACTRVRFTCIGR